MGEALRGRIPHHQRQHTRAGHTVDLHGEINLLTMDVFTEHVCSHLDLDSVTHVFIDVQDVTFIDSCGIGALAASTGPCKPARPFELSASTTGSPTVSVRDFVGEVVIRQAGTGRPGGEDHQCQQWTVPSRAR